MSGKPYDATKAHSATGTENKSRSGNKNDLPKPVPLIDAAGEALGHFGETLLVENDYLPQQVLNIAGEQP